MIVNLDNLEYPLMFSLIYNMYMYLCVCVQCVCVSVQCKHVLLSVKAGIFRERGQAFQEGCPVSLVCTLGWLA